MRILILAVVGLAAALAAQPCGDCDGDGLVGILDALQAARAGASLVTLSSPLFEQCNVIGTPGAPPGGSVTIVDALCIAQYAAGLPIGIACSVAPACAAGTPAGCPCTGTILIDYQASDAFSTPVDLAVSFTTDAGLTWIPATEGSGGDGTTGLSTSPTPGDAHVFAWDAAADGVGGLAVTPARLQLTLTSTGGSSGCLTGVIDVDNRTSWTQVTAAAPWHARTDHTSVVFDSKIWVIGGFWHLGIGNNHYLNDVWYSDDGATWTEATPAAPWEPRFDHASAVYDGKIWVIGGSYDNGTAYSYPRNDVWYSDDGVTWIEATPVAPWGERGAMGCVVFDGKLWVIGGAHQYSAYNDAWWTTDGATWTLATVPAAPWMAVCGHTCLVHQSEIRLLGGIAITAITEDVWTTPDGASWSQLTPTVPWGPRYDYTAVVRNGVAWVLGGQPDGATLPASDVWSSPDGITWTQVTAAAPWDDRKDHSSVVFNGKLWILGGNTGATYFGDVWSSP
jgi:hypothetical protein